MNIIEIIAQDLFDKVRSRFTNLQMGTEEGAVTSDPKEARFFDFDFVLEGNNLGRVSLSINERGSLKIFYSQGITEGTDSITRGLWYDFLKEMRYFAKRRMMRFDTRDITKGNLNKNDFQYLAQNGSKETDMNESSMYGSSKTSYRKLENTRLVVRHGKAVDEAKAGDRSRHINALFIENADGERFKYPYNHLAGAKAMQRHVANGGRPYDDAGTAIIQMSEQISQLATFKRHAKTGQLNDDANMIHARVGAKLEQLRHNLNSIQGQKSYESWMESFVPSSIDNDLDPVTMEDYKNKFTVKQFDETLASVFPLIHSIMKEAGTIDLEDLVHEGEEETCDECGMLESKCECDDVDEAYNPNSVSAQHRREIQSNHEANIRKKAETGDPDAKKRLELMLKHKERRANDYAARMERESVGFENFENWADAISEGTMTPDQVAQFKDLISSGLTLGPDGTSAIEALAGIGIEDPALEQALKGLAAVDPAADPLETIEAWLKVNDPEVLTQLGGGEEEQPAPEAPPAEEPAPEAPPAPEAGVEQPVAEEEQMDNKEQKLEDPAPNLKELAEFIGAFYNPHAREQGLGEWRKGPTELGIMAGKQFGDRAGKVVELMVTRMQQQSQGNHEFAEVMKLAGVNTQEASHQAKTTMKHIKNPTAGEKKASKDIKAGTAGYKDRIDMLKSAEKDGRLKSDEGFDVMLRLAGLAK